MGLYFHLNRADKKVPLSIDPEFTKMVSGMAQDSCFDGEVPAPRTLCDFLNDFEDHHIEGLNVLLNRRGQGFHRLLKEEHAELISKDRIMDIDST